MIPLLQDKWQHLVAPWLSAELSSIYLAELLAAYQSPLRAYHSLAHVAELLSWADYFEDTLSNYAAVCLAIWYHDAVYNVYRHDNEARSAELFLSHFAHSTMPLSEQERITHYIQATAGHRPQAGEEENDLLYFLDFDLSPLGTSTERYVQAAASIRHEYAHVEASAYQVGRCSVLESFLHRDFIYSTAFFRQHFELAARLNLQHEIARLRY